MDAILDLRLHLLPHLLVCIYQGEPLVYLPHHALALSAWQWGLAVHVCTHLRVPTCTALHCVVAVAHYNCISARSHARSSSIDSMPSLSVSASLKATSFTLAANLETCCRTARSKVSLRSSTRSATRTVAR